MWVNVFFVFHEILDLDNALPEDDSNIENGSESLFSDLYLDYVTPSTSTKDDSSSPMYQSPIRYKSKREFHLSDLCNIHAHVCNSVL